VGTFGFWFTVAFIPIHVYWAMGGTFWLPATALIPANKPAVQVANWGVAVLLATGAAIVLALARPAGRRVHPALLLAPMSAVDPPQWRAPARAPLPRQPGRMPGTDQGELAAGRLADSDGSPSQVIWVCCASFGRSRGPPAGRQY
jgi:hypothetical protein